MAKVKKSARLSSKSNQDTARSGRVDYSEYENALKAAAREAREKKKQDKKERDEARKEAEEAAASANDDGNEDHDAAVANDAAAVGEQPSVADDNVAGSAAAAAAGSAAAAAGERRPTSPETSLEALTDLQGGHAVGKPEELAKSPSSKLVKSPESKFAKWQSKKAKSRSSQIAKSPLSKEAKSRSSQLGKSPLSKLANSLSPMGVLRNEIVFDQMYSDHQNLEIDQPNRINYMYQFVMLWLSELWGAVLTEDDMTWVEHCVNHMKEAHDDMDGPKFSTKVIPVEELKKHIPDEATMINLLKITKVYRYVLTVKKEDVELTPEMMATIDANWGSDICPMIGIADHFLKEAGHEKLGRLRLSWPVDPFRWPFPDFPFANVSRSCLIHDFTICAFS